MTSSELVKMQAAKPQSGARVVPPFWRLVVKKANPITPLNTQGLTPALYCVHPIAGDVTSFYTLAERVDKSVSFYGIQVPLEMMKADFGRSISEMARFYVSSLVTFQPEGPIVLAGWSAGAIIALEMAQQLRAQGRSVPLLIALDGAPCNTDSRKTLWHPDSLIRILKNIPFWITDEVRQAGTWSDLFDSIRGKINFRWRRAFPDIKNEQTLDGDAVQELLGSRTWSDSQMAFIRALYEALRTYQPSAYEGPVLVFESRTQPLLNLRDVGTAWRKVSQHVESVVLKSNHMGIFREPTLGLLARRLKDRSCAAHHRL